MPELPEVETIKNGIQPFLIKQYISEVTVRQPQLRLPVSTELQTRCPGQKIIAVSRRGKYILIHLKQAYIIIHLGMSGCLRILQKETQPQKHDHIDLHLSDGNFLRYHDPRRFGLWQYSDMEISTHPLLKHLGPEPFSEIFDSHYLLARIHKKNQAIKKVIMDHRVVVGVGNIYASESLYYAGIHPLKPANQLSRKQLSKLIDSIQHVLNKAIQAGGTTLKDFTNSAGQPGYFANELSVYGRENQPCLVCASEVMAQMIGGRNSYFCPNCQPI